MSAEPEADERVRPRVEIGWLLVGPLSPAARELVESARREVRADLEEEFPEFSWHFPVVEDRGAVEARAEPVALLQRALEERLGRSWDLVLVVTAADLVARYKPFALATPSRAAGAAAISTHRLGEAKRPATRARLRNLAMHLLGDLLGLDHREEPGAIMRPPADREDLAEPADWSDEERDSLAAALREVADARLEEKTHPSRIGSLGFALNALWIGRREIVGGVIQARPWEFPFRLSRLTTAALSTVLILLMTAEAWDLGMRQPPWRVGLLATLALVGTTLFVVKRHRLLGGRGAFGRSTEQAVVGRATVILVVFLGMAVSFTLFFALALAIERFLFDPSLARVWAATMEEEIRARHYLVLAGFVTTLGILMGSLGASFEGHSYFLHVIYVDEEA